ncbi:MAG: 50S ribosomal protein L10 [bacterium]
MNKTMKTQVIENLKTKMNKSCGIILSDYKGLNVEAISLLRSNLAKIDAEFLVAKNTLAVKTVKEIGLEDLIPQFKGPVAITFSYTDIIFCIKVMQKFANENVNLKIKAGVLDKKIINKEAINQIAILPSKEELLTKLVYTIKLPLINLINIFQCPIKKLIWVTKNIEKKEGI